MTKVELVHFVLKLVRKTVLKTTQEVKLSPQETLQIHKSDHWVDRDGKGIVPFQLQPLLGVCSLFNATVCIVGN